MRVKGGPVTQRRHKKILKMVKGQWGTRSKLFRRGNEAMMKSYWYAYRDRRVRRREFRKLWITRINAASRQNGLSYSRLMHGLKLANVGIDRKALADIAVRDGATFAALVDVAQKALENGGPSRKVVEMVVTRPGAVGHTNIQPKPVDNSKEEPQAKKAQEKAPEPVVEPQTPIEVDSVEEMQTEAQAKETPAEAAEPVVEPQTPIEVEAAEEMQAEAEAATSKEPAVEKSKAAKKAKKDNLKKIEGIGPKIAGVLNDAGIETFAQLAALSVEELDKIVRQDAGVTIAKPDTWPEQAALAAEGKMEELEALQNSLKGGVRQ